MALRWGWLLLALFVLWQGHSLSTVFFPPTCSSDLCSRPRFDLAKETFDLALYAVRGEVVDPWRQLGSAPLPAPFLEKRALDVRVPWEERVVVPLYPDTRLNGSLSLVVLLAASSTGGLDALRGRPSFQGYTLLASVPLTQYLPLRWEPERYLLHNASTHVAPPTAAAAPVIMTHWKPWVKLRVVLDSNRYDLQPGQPRDSVHVPHVYADELHLPLGALMPLSNDTTRAHPPLRLRFLPTSVGVHRLLTVLDQAVNQVLRGSAGLSRTETDELLMLLSPDNLYVLALTYTVSMLHALFAGMAFKNEIAFWSSSRDLYGMSRRSVIGNAVCSLILFLFLWDSQGTSWLVVATMGMHAVVDAWKVTKVLGMNRTLRCVPPGVFIVSFVAYALPVHSEAEKHTNDIDAMGMRYLWMLLWPLIIGWAGYSLYAYPHRSWYSWAITSAAHGVYGFGFLLMWPQIFVNRRLQSVAHLPWRALTYKIFSTFVDDLFAWIINAPTIHRLATLRDDLVFAVFLYQRFTYRVDPSRVNEFGYRYDNEEKKLK